MRGWWGGIVCHSGQSLTFTGPKTGFRERDADGGASGLLTASIYRSPGPVCSGSEYVTQFGVLRICLQSRVVWVKTR